ncbi:MAG: hypothetical protein ACFE9S_06990 [Candidatus Hermodarchaeota archaeon]
MIIVLVLSKFDDGNDYLEILEKFNQEIDKLTEEVKLKENLEAMFHISLDAFRTTDEVITKLSNEVALLKTREYDYEVKFDFITKTNHLPVKSKILFLLAIKDYVKLEDLREVIKTKKQWLLSVLDTLVKIEVVGYNSENDSYYLKV